ncbi:hypothetical protein QFC20_006733 [Naganishia adeliensis]|uniref:Uncharacterized protein n=1 Tax=Naganishia adeliensis TaxID=92952 RepID=A0ACC2V7L7_9TREE|nr:hypothetical protein QFC20_006733 [Naganishia adeliensis]
MAALVAPRYSWVAYKPYPELNKAIVLQLSDLREAGLGVNVCSATAIIRSNIDRLVPNLFEEKNFVLSHSFVTRYLKTELDWSYRVATNAAKKVPDDWERLCTDAILRISRVMKNFRVPPALVINGDQTGVNLFPSENKTYAKKGSKHITLMVTSSMDGKLLPFQAIFKGKTDGSLPGKNERKPAETMGMKFEPGGDKHWTNLDTTKKIVIPYIKEVKLEQGLPDKQYAILYIDYWSVLFAGWLAEQVTMLREYKSDARGTILNQVWKSSFSTPALRDIVPVFMVQILADVSARQALIRKSWSKCEAGGLSLDPFEIESERTQQAFQDRCLECFEFGSQSMLHNIPEDGEFPQEDAADNEDHDAPDDLDVAPEELEAELLLNLRKPRVERDPNGVVVSTQGNLID